MSRRQFNTPCGGIVGDRPARAGAAGSHATRAAAPCSYPDDAAANLQQAETVALDTLKSWPKGGAHYYREITLPYVKTGEVREYLPEQL